MAEVGTETQQTAEDAPPSPERRAELQAAYAANVAAGRAPYQEVAIRTRGELAWILAERGWDAEHDQYTVKYVLEPRGISISRADLRYARMSGANLSGVSLIGARLERANLTRANLTGAVLIDADLYRADLGYATLARVDIRHANLTDAHLREVDLHEANLKYTNLEGARLFRNDLRGAALVGARLNSATVLAESRLDARTQLRDISWNGAPMAAVDWDAMKRLGDEHPPESLEQRGKPVDQLVAYRGAVRAYQQLAVTLQGQGMSEAAARFTYRAQVLQRKLYRQHRQYGRWLFSLMLDALSGYGYRLSRIFIAYVTIVIVFAAIYLGLGLPGDQTAPLAQQVRDAFLTSLTALHGRTFQEQLGAYTVLAWVAAAESILGIVIEGIFVAMLIQRFFSR